MRLPFNDEIRQQLTHLREVKVTDDWEQLLDLRSIHRLLYSLIILEEIIEKDTTMNWRLKFNGEKRGLDHLLKIFCTVDQDEHMGAHLMIKFNASLLKILAILCETETVNETIRVNMERITMTIFDKLGNVSQADAPAESESDLYKFVESSKAFFMTLLQQRDCEDKIIHVISGYLGLENLIYSSLISHANSNFSQRMAQFFCTVVFSE